MKPSYEIKMFCVVFLIGLLILSISGCSGSSDNDAAPPSRTGIFISDIHFNPLSDPAIADAIAQATASQWDAIYATSNQTTCASYLKEFPLSDTNFVLLNSAIAAMKAQVPNPDIIIISGDMLVHYFLELVYNKTVTNPTQAGYAALVYQTEQYLAMKLIEAFPNAQILPTLGDWDSDTGVDSTPASSAFFQSFASAWSSAVNRSGSSPDFMETFPAGGYYQAKLPINPNAR